MKVEHPHIMITYSKGVFQKYSFVVETTSDNIKKTKDYKVVSIDNFNPDTNEFKIVAEIIVNELKK